ncbi:hypothetical protein QFZ24_000062 [Streptomyces phaeochromogenes]|nr:hypothetical protein [Streptomyces phaeochromogenes]
MQVAVGGRGRDAVVAGELGDTRAVDEPAQDQYRLLEDAQGPGAFAGPEPLAVAAQQPGEVLGRYPG